MILMQAIGIFFSLVGIGLVSTKFITMALELHDAKQDIERYANRTAYLEHKVLDITMYLESKRKR